MHKWALRVRLKPRRRADHVFAIQLFSRNFSHRWLCAIKEQRAAQLFKIRAAFVCRAIISPHLARERVVFPAVDRRAQRFCEQLTARPRPAEPVAPPRVGKRNIVLNIKV
ncbi:hypothetical protein SDC9_185262 [bioreactor metagenome]|uniref:Uncharacterized protein n=1 Tax=bioreactor metagenome TaxID=1076179 RepID=A0A645HFG1_9ZZZZ